MPFWLMTSIWKVSNTLSLLESISVIVPVVGEYTEKSSAQALQGAKKERLAKIIREARQQSGSPVDTKVTEPVGLEEAMNLWRAGGFDTPASQALNHRSTLYSTLLLA